MNDYLDQVEAQLTELTERGAHRRLRTRRPMLGGGGSRPPRRRSEAFALLAAALVAVAVVAIVVLNVGTGTPHRTAAPAASTARHSNSTGSGGYSVTTTETTSTTTSSSTPLPSQFFPQSFTAIGELTWWLLGSEPCPAGAKAPCAGILQTTNGGRTFTAIHPPAAPLSAYSQVRFADAKDGFAYGPDLYATHDGGMTWHVVDVGGKVTDLAISSGQAFAIVADHLMRSPVGQDQWTPVPAAGEVSGGLWLLGNEVIVQSGNGGGYGTDLLVSQNGGEGFSHQPAPSPGLPCDFQAQSPQTIWAKCATGTESGVWYASDYVAGFATAHGSGLPPLPNSAVFAAASNTTAVVGYQQLYRTGDAGRTWDPTGPSGIAQWAYVGFTDSTHGVALGYVGSVAPANERLYYTTDGGQSYHLVPLP